MRKRNLIFVFLAGWLLAIVISPQGLVGMFRGR